MRVRGKEKKKRSLEYAVRRGQEESETERKEEGEIIVRRGHEAKTVQDHYL